MKTGQLTNWGGHLLLSYASDAERVTGLAGWAQDGLDARERLLCADVPGPLGVVQLLEGAGVAGTRAVDRGALELVTPEGQEATATPGALRARLTEALDAGY